MSLITTTTILCAKWTPLKHRTPSFAPPTPHNNPTCGWGRDIVVLRELVWYSSLGLHELACLLEQLLLGAGVKEADEPSFFYFLLLLPSYTHTNLALILLLSSLWIMTRGLRFLVIPTWETCRFLVFYWFYICFTYWTHDDDGVWLCMWFVQ